MLSFTLLYFLIVFVCCSRDYGDSDSKLIVSPATFEDTGNPFYEFTCETESKRHQWLSWYQEKTSKKEPIFLITENRRERLQKLDLLLPIDQSDFGSIIYCVSHKEYFVNGKKKYEEISRSDEIQIIFDKNNYPLKKPATPQVTPATFNDNGEPIAEFTCWAHLRLESKQRPRLSWYQVKGKGNTPQLMNVTELRPRYYADLKVIFWKILEPSDIGSYIYCAKETTYYSSTYPYRENNISVEVSDPITFTTKRKPNEIWGPWTNSTTISADGKFLNNNCSAYLGRGKLLTWFQIKGPNTQTRLAMIQQPKDFGKIEINLRKTLDVSDEGTEIYCARERVDDKVTFKTEEVSQRSFIKFGKHIETSEAPYVKVSPSPSSDIIVAEKGTRLDFNCSGSKLVDGRSYVWNIRGPYLDSPVDLDRKPSNNNVILHSLQMEEPFHMSRLYCHQVFVFELELPNSQKTHYYEEVARSDNITLVLQGYGYSNDKPHVTPVRYGDQDKFLIVSCYCFLLPWEILSWYQYKESQTDHDLLRTKQLQDTTYDKGQWVILTLNKTLEPSDRDSNVYCSKQKLLQNGNYTEDKISSQTIPLTILRDILPLNTYFSIEPDYNVYFEVNMSQRFTCSGSPPVDGRMYSWFRIDLNDNLTMPVNQSYDSSLNLNVLELSLDETFERNQLFCAQIFLSDIKDENGGVHRKYYSILAKSKKISLYRGVNDDSRNTILAVIIPILLAIVVGLAYWKLRRYRSIHNTSTITAPAEDYQEKPKETESKSTPYPSKTKGSTAETSQLQPKHTPRSDLTLNPLKSTKIRPTTAPKPEIAARPFVAPLQTPLTPIETPVSTATHPDITLLKCTETRPTIAPKPDIAARPFVLPLKIPLTPTGTPVSTATLTTVTPKPPTTPEDDPIYGNYITLFADMDPDHVTYACLDLPKNKSASIQTQDTDNIIYANIRGTSKTTASADASRTNASVDRKATLATSESSPYAQIIGVYTPLKSNSNKVIK